MKTKTAVSVATVKLSYDPDSPEIAAALERFQAHSGNPKAKLDDMLSAFADAMVQQKDSFFPEVGYVHFAEMSDEWRQNCQPWSGIYCGDEDIEFSTFIQGSSANGSPMRLNRCHICHSNLNVFALAEDEASAKLLGKLSTFDTLTGNALMGYLTLFAPAKTALTSSKSLRIVNEVEALADGDWARAAVAMATTVESIRSQRQQGKETSVFNSHTYLKKVLAQTEAQPLAPVVAPLGGQTPSLPAQVGQPQSAVGKALAMMEAMKYE